jgi:hypothetical protein
VSLAVADQRITKKTGAGDAKDCASRSGVGDKSKD